MSYRYWNFIHYHFPYFWARHLYAIELGKKLNLSNPQDLNEKILWLEFFTDTRHWSTLADKYAVRAFVKERVGEEVLVPLLGKWDNAIDIDFDALPDRFVIKPNNGSYDTIVVTDKSKADLEDIRKRMEYSMNHKFGFENAEPHYLRIKPCIIAEQLLETTQKEGLVDYKIWCFNGEPYIILTCFNRNSVTHHADLMVYDLDWIRHPEYLIAEFKNECHCPKPSNFKQMLYVASKLSEGLPECRVDLYNIDGKIVFGEMTLTSNYGMMPYFTQEILNEIGDLCILPQRNKTEKIKSFINRFLPR